ncbi:putative reverse transcriptase domain-containing protein [Tanacetum coccineum]
MPPRMRTRSAGRPAAESLGGGMGERIGRGGRGRRPREGNDEHVEDLNGQGNDQGLGANRGVEGVNGNVEGANGGAPDFSTIIAQQLQNLLPAMLAQVSNRGNVGNQNGNVVNENVQENVGNVLVNGNRVVMRCKCWTSVLWNHVMVGVGHVAYTDRVHEDGGSIRAKTMQKAVQIYGREIWVLGPKCTTCNSYLELEGLLAPCFNCNRPGHLAKDCSGVPRNVNPINNRNPTVRAYYECGSTDHVRSACPRLNRAQEPKGNRPNQVAANTDGTFTLNDHFATTLFDFGADYCFVSTTFIPLLGLEPSELGFRYEIEIASGKLVEIDKVIKGCKLEIEVHVFDIDLIPFGHGSFDVIIGMDWLSNYKAEIICHEKVVRIPLPYGKVLRVVGERPEEKARLLMSAKASDKKQEEIVVVRDFPKVFPDDLSRLSHIWEIEFRIELIPRATPLEKSPYRLAPSEMEELSG